MSDVELQSCYRRVQEVARRYGFSVRKNSRRLSIQGEPFRIENQAGETLYSGNISGAIRCLVDATGMPKSDRDKLRFCA